MPELTDSELLTRVNGGDPASFDVLLRRHEKRIYNLAYRMMGNQEDARDASQETFVSAYRRLDSFRGDAAFSTWLYRIAVNCCYDALRTRARTPEPMEMAEDEADTRPDPADRAGTTVDVQRALTQVPEEFRSVLILHDVQDEPYERIAEILDIPVGTVKSRLHRGRATLGRILSGTTSPDASSEGAR